MKKKEHLPLFGVGPIYVYSIAILTLLAFISRNLSVFEAGKLTSIKSLLIILGGILIIAGAIMWIMAVIVSKVDDNIKKNHLVTTGIYAWVRNPIYSAFMIANTGIILIIGNAFFFVLPFVYWLFMTVLMKHTEEKWLHNLYGQEYEDYCKRVNRCIPWKRN
jgi:protein-S-isoprenylcysteine O-methyltransferase Ste14